MITMSKFSIALFLALSVLLLTQSQVMADPKLSSKENVERGNDLSRQKKHQKAYDLYYKDIKPTRKFKDWLKKYIQKYDIQTDTDEFELPPGTSAGSKSERKLIPKRVAVIDLQAKEGVSVSVAELLSDNLRATLFDFGTFDLMNREDMTAIFKELKFQASGACDTACVVETGMALGVEKMISGSIGKVGDLYAVSLRMVDIEKARNEVVLAEQYAGSENGLPSFISTTGEKLADRAMKIWAKAEGWTYTPPKRKKGRKSQVIYREKTHKTLVAGILGIFPGFGQRYNKQKTKALVLGGLHVVGLGGTIISFIKGTNAKNEYLSAQSGSDFEGLFAVATKSRKLNHTIALITVGITGISVLDALLSAGGYEKRVSVSFQQSGGGILFAYKF